MNRHTFSSVLGCFQVKFAIRVYNLLLEYNLWLEFVPRIMTNNFKILVKFLDSRCNRIFLVETMLNCTNIYVQIVCSCRVSTIYFSKNEHKHTYSSEWTYVCNVVVVSYMLSWKNSFVAPETAPCPQNWNNEIGQLIIFFLFRFFEDSVCIHELCMHNS